MWPYWIMFLLPAVAAFLAPHTSAGGTVRVQAPRWTLGWVFAFAAILLMVGYRYEVGGDWFNYLRYLDLVVDSALTDALTLSDPGYIFLAWISVRMGWDIYGLNLLGGLIFTAGLISFCRGLPRPWLALTVAMPYLVLVLGMGYSRQGVALGLVMLGLHALAAKSNAKFVFWVLLGATFHKTAVLLLPIAALATAKNRYWTMLWVGALAAAAYVVFLADSREDLLAGYVDAELQSEGALVRLLMNALPAALFLTASRKFGLTEAQASLWRWFSILSLVLLAALFVAPSSTVIDRIALYLLPLQLMVFSYLPEVFGDRRSMNRGWVGAVVVYYAVVLFVWLNFATNAAFWIPYRFYPLEQVL